MSARLPNSDRSNRNDGLPRTYANCWRRAPPRRPRRSFSSRRPTAAASPTREFDAAVNRTARMLSAHGVGRGDVVSLLLPNGASTSSPISRASSWARSPAPSTPCSSPKRWPTSSATRRRASCSSAASSPNRSADLRREVRRRSGRCSRLRRRGAPRPPGCDGTDDEGWRDSDLTRDDEAIIIYTSGTTGKPKGCLLTHGNLLANARQIVEWLGFNEDDRLLTVMPLFHMNAVSVTTVSALYAGGSTVTARASPPRASGRSSATTRSPPSARSRRCSRCCSRLTPKACPRA